MIFKNKILISLCTVSTLGLIFSVISHFTALYGFETPERHIISIYKNRFEEFVSNSTFYYKNDKCYLNTEYYDCPAVAVHLYESIQLIENTFYLLNALFSVGIIYSALYFLNRIEATTKKFIFVWAFLYSIAAFIFVLISLVAIFQGRKDIGLFGSITRLYGSQKEVMYGFINTLIADFLGLVAMVISAVYGYHLYKNDQEPLLDINADI